MITLYHFPSLKNSLGGTDALDAAFLAHCLVQCPAKPFKHRFNNVMRVAACQEADVNGGLRVVGKGPEKFFHQFCVEAAELSCGNGHLETKVRPAAEIYRG